MIIDWYTVIFQMINFLVLVFLLRRYLYGPVIRVMDERQEMIERRQEEADARQAEAEAAAARYHRQEALLKEEKSKLLEEAKGDAAEERKKLTEKARLEVEQTRRQWETAFLRERETFVRELRREIGRQGCLIARRAIEDLAQTGLESLVWDVFTDKLRQLKGENEAKLREALSRENSRAIVSSAFEVPEGKLEQLQQCLAERFAPGVELIHERQPNLICGLALDAGGHRLSWNVEHYLEDVERKIMETLDQVKEAAPGE